MLKKAACLASLSGALLFSVQSASAQADDNNHGGMCHEMNMPLLSSPDVNGDGVIDEDDVSLVAEAQNGEYHLLYDMNIDGVINQQDVIAIAQRQGDAVPLVDSQVAQTAQATFHLTTHDAAVANNYLPGTQWFDGHGYHYIDAAKLANDFSFTAPAGVNMDQDGNQTAVFWFIDADLYPKPEGFDGHEDMWHHHAEVCAYNLGGKNAAGEIDTSKPFFVQDSSYVLASFTGVYAPYDPVATCGTLGYILRTYGVVPSVSNPGEVLDLARNKFYMLHLWTEKVNYCGRFAGEDPDVVWVD
jgi:hypothetical protein